MFLGSFLVGWQGSLGVGFEWAWFTVIDYSAFQPLRRGRGGWEENCDKVGDKCQEIFPPSFFFFIIKQQHDDVPHGETLQSQPLRVVRLCSFFVSLVQLVFYDGGGGGGDSLVLASFGLQGGSVLTAPRSGQGRGARVASDPERERERGWMEALIPFGRERGLCLDLFLW